MGDRLAEPINSVKHTSEPRSRSIAKARRASDERKNNGLIRTAWPSVLLSIGWHRAGRAKPLTHLNSRLGLAGLPQPPLPLYTLWHHLSLAPETLCFRNKPLLK